MHDPSLCKRNKYIGTYVESLNVGGFLCYELIRQSNYLRDDDYVPSVVSFSLTVKNEEDINEDLLALEHELSANVTSVKSSLFLRIF